MVELTGERGDERIEAHILSATLIKQVPLYVFLSDLSDTADLQALLRQIQVLLAEIVQQNEPLGSR